MSLILIRKFKKFFSKPAPKKTRRVKKVFTKGKVYDLQEIFDRLNEEYFEKKVELTIGWFGSASRKAARRRLLGSYGQLEGHIKIHRLLDNEQFPPYFISFIVYHEMLHHVCPPKTARRGRRRVHHSEFKAKEKEFRDFSLANEWQKENLKQFFTSRG